MMIKEVFNSEEEFIDFVVENNKERDLVILGGHYLLLYNDIDSCLEPAILEENRHIHLKQTSQILAGNFPLRSFELSAKIKKRRSEVSKVALLVNDHYFQSSSFNLLSEDRLNGNWGSYRAEYFANSVIPDAYLQSLAKYNLDVATTILQNQGAKNSTNYHPHIFSETYLRKKFDKKLKSELSYLDNFYLQNSKNDGSELIYKGGIDNLTCITQNGSCGCSGEVMQFITEVFNLSFTNITMLVPQECYQSVCTGVEAYIDYLKSLGKTEESNLIVATGFGDHDFEKIWNDNRIHVCFFNV